MFWRVGFFFFRFVCWLVLVFRFDFRVVYFAVAGGEPGTNFLWIVMKWSHSAAIGDAARFVDDVETFGPGGVCVVCGVGHFVDAEGNGEVVTLGEIVADCNALLEGFRLGIANVFFDVGFHLPLVGGMRFANVDSQKICVIFVIVEELNDVADLATEGRSSKASENQD